MKKVISILLVSIMLIGLLAGCGKSTKEDNVTESTTADTSVEQEKITISLSWWGNQLRNDLTQQAADLYMELNPNIEVKTEFTDWTGYWDKLSTMAAAGDLPDIIQQDYSYISQYQKSDQLANLNEFLEDGTIDTTNIPDSIIASGTIDGNCYAISLGSNAPLMSYDKALVESAGIKIPLQPTVDEIYEIGQKIYEATGVTTYFDGGFNMLQIVARANGSHLFDELFAGETEASRINFENVQKFAEAEFTISAELLVEKNPDIVETKPIIDGTTWNDFSFSNQFISISNTVEKDLGICMFPTLADAKVQSIYLKPSMFFSVAETSKHKEEAAKFLNWFVNSTEANDILSAERGIPINTKVAEEMLKNVDSVAAQVFTYIGEVGKVAEPIDAPNPPGSGEVLALEKNLVEDIRFGDMDSDEAAEKFVEKSKSILEEAAK